MDDFSFLDLFWSILIIYALFAYIMILFSIVADLFRDRSASGWAKAGWIVLFIALPLLGVLIYLIARGRGMAERASAAQEASKQEFDSYVREVAAPAATPAEQIAHAKQLLDSGAITQEEFEALKSKALA